VLQKLVVPRGQGQGHVAAESAEVTLVLASSLGLGDVTGDG